MISKHKNMKKYKYIIGLGVLLSGLVIFFACEDRLDKLPYSDTEASYFTSQANFEGGILGIYAKLTDWYWYANNDCLYDFWLLPGDDLTTREDRNYEHFAALQPGDGHVNRYWTTAYQIIGRANVMLEKIEEVEDGIYVDANLKNYNKGEALFLRALCFYRLWSYYGTAPIITTRISGIGEQTKPLGSTGTQMLDQAITDLTEAASLLPDKWEAENAGRATSDAAYGLLGKCYVTRACYGGGTADYTAAITAFNNIQNAQLTPQFGSNFDAWDENNIESLFEFQGSEAKPSDNIWLSNDFGTIGSMSSYFGYFNCLWDWWSGMPWVPTDKLRAAFEPGDPRINETFQANSGVNYDGWEFIKYTKRDMLAPGTSGASLNNPRILRYGDVLLMRAEAYLQTGNAVAALADVNAIRKRARESDPVSAVPADLATVTMQNIMDERFRELAGEEGYRFLDLKRWDAAGYIDLGSWSNDDFGPSLRTTDINFEGWYSETQGKMLYPIPTGEIDFNPNISQNTGY
jgi:starch-binding outer membrane protein, SusD/RagB family